MQVSLSGLVLDPEGQDMMERELGGSLTAIANTWLPGYTWLRNFQVPLAGGIGTRRG